MIAIASILDTNASNKTRELWKWLNDKCSCSDIKLTQTPHLSWQTADDYDLDTVQNIIKNIVKRVKPFTFATSGLGIFTEDKYILYLAVPVSSALINLHDLLWNELGESAKSRNTLYKNGIWVPHISIIFDSVESDQLICAIKELLFSPIAFRVEVKSIDILYNMDDEYGVLSRHYMDK